MRDGIFAPVRPAVLGHVIECRSDGKEYRVRTAAPLPERVLVTGDRRAAERALVEALERRFGQGLPNIVFPTLGGKQYWGDRYWYGGWRIQQNAETGHCRLLDLRDVRRAWGTYEACRTALERARLEGRVRAPRPHLVVLLHGLGRAKATMDPLRLALEEKGYSVAALSYPSTRRGIAEHVDQIEAVLADVEGVERISFVTHSLGGIIARGLLGRPSAAWRERMTPYRLVMLAPPNRGARLAEIASELELPRAILGPCIEGLVGGAATLSPAVDIPFGIIAGARGDSRGWNPFIEGDDDGIVGVEETKLTGCTEFLTLRRFHTFIMRDATAIRAVQCFLAGGRMQDALRGGDR